MHKIVITDPGHGGIDPTTGQYTTAPAKMFVHTKGEFHNKKIFYEGVQNRVAERILHEILGQKGVPFISTVPGQYKHIDTNLNSRVALEHNLNQHLDTFFLSIHFNASGTHQARGTSIWTSPGQTKSDIWGEKIYQNLDKRLGSIIKMRSQTYNDGDHDYEAAFYVCRKTKSISVLLEILFFDNYEDAILSMNEDFLFQYMHCVAEVLEEWYFK